MRTLRLLVAVIGAYAFANGYVAITAVGLTAAGLARGEAVMFGAITGYFAWLSAGLWAIASPRPRRTAAIIIGLSATLIFAAPKLTDLVIA